MSDCKHAPDQQGLCHNCGMPMGISAEEWTVVQAMRTTDSIKEVIITTAKDLTYEMARDLLIEQAGTAIELFGEDELERYAKELEDKKENSCFNHYKFDPECGQCLRNRDIREEECQRKTSSDQDR